MSPLDPLDRYRAIIEDTARELEVDASIRIPADRLAAWLRELLADPTAFDEPADMATAFRARGKEPLS